MTDINYSSQLNSTGGALAKSTSKPKNMYAEADAKFLASLNSRELELKDI